MNSFSIEKINIADVEKSYRGKTECACGCGGDYYYADEALEIKQLEIHIKYINAHFQDAEFNGQYVQVYNPSSTRVTRLYFRSGFHFYRTTFGVDKIID